MLLPNSLCRHQRRRQPHHPGQVGGRGRLRRAPATRSPHLLGTKITGTWRLDTPYLENLVDLVGNIDISTDADVPGAKQGGDPVVKKGDDQTLTGPMAVAYATYRAPARPRPSSSSGSAR